MIPIYVIHALHLPERKADLDRQLSGFGLAADWITDFDPPDISDDLAAEMLNPGHELSRPQLSCALKHLEAHRRIAAQGHQRGLVLEDDAILCDDFPAKLDAVITESLERGDLHSISLGAANNLYTPSDRLRDGQLLYPATRVRNGEAYLLGAAEAQIRLDWIERQKISIPIDGTFSACDKACGIQILWSEPPLAEQGSLTGRYVSTLETKQRSRIRLKLQFLYQKLRRRYLSRRLGSM